MALSLRVLSPNNGNVYFVGDGVTSSYTFPVGQYPLDNIPLDFTRVSVVTTSPSTTTASFDSSKNHVTITWTDGPLDDGQVFGTQLNMVVTKP